MEEVSYDDFKKLQMCVGLVKEVDRIPGTDKLFKMQIDIGKSKLIQIVTSLVDHYRASELKDKKIIVLTNLKSSQFAGQVSEGMLLCAEKEDKSKCVLLTIDKDIEQGTPVT